MILLMCWLFDWIIKRVQNMKYALKQIVVATCNTEHRGIGFLVDKCEIPFLIPILMMEFCWIRLWARYKYLHAEISIFTRFIIFVWPLFHTKSALFTVKVFRFQITTLLYYANSNFVKYISAARRGGLRNLTRALVFYSRVFTWQQMRFGSLTSYKI